EERRVPGRMDRAGGVPVVLVDLVGEFLPEVQQFAVARGQIGEDLRRAGPEGAGVGDAGGRQGLVGDVVVQDPVDLDSVEVHAVGHGLYLSLRGRGGWRAPAAVGETPR